MQTSFVLVQLLMVRQHQHNVKQSNEFVNHWIFYQKTSFIKQHNIQTYASLSSEIIVDANEPKPVFTPYTTM
jgi:hypothetical protein